VFAIHSFQLSQPLERENECHSRLRQQLLTLLARSQACQPWTRTMKGDSSAGSSMFSKWESGGPGIPRDIGSARLLAEATYMRDNVISRRIELLISGFLP